MFNLFNYTEKKLVKELQAILARNEPDLNVEHNPDTNTVSISGGQRFGDAPMTINLANLFVKMRSLKTAERMARLEANLQELLSDHEFTTDDLIESFALRVRTLNELSIRDLYMQNLTNESLSTLMIDANELQLELVSDRPESLATVDQATLDKADITKEEAFEIARSALARATDLTQWLQVDDHIWRSSYGDDYDFARVVAAGDSLRLPSGSDAFFYAPSHSVVLMSDSQQQDVIQKMLDIGEHESQDHRPLSQNLWHFNSETQWTKWLPEPNGSLAHLQAYRELINSYSEQKNLLDDLLKKNGEDSFVASYQVYEKDGHYRSMCVYTLNVPSYLPRTEWVTIFDADLGDQGNIVGEMAWQDFVNAIGEEVMPEISNGRLERYKLLSTLSDEQEATLRA